MQIKRSRELEPLARLGPWTARGVPPYGRTVGTARGRQRARRPPPDPTTPPPAHRPPGKPPDSKHQHPRDREGKAKAYPAGAIQSDGPSLTPEALPCGGYTERRTQSHARRPNRFGWRSLGAAAPRLGLRLASTLSGARSCAALCRALFVRTSKDCVIHCLPGSLLANVRYCHQPSGTCSDDGAALRVGTYISRRDWPSWGYVVSWPS